MTKTIKIALVLLAFGMYHTQARACDACGCALGGFNFGVIPQNEAHFVGVRYAIAQFYANSRHGGVLEYSNDTYQRADFMARIALNEKLQLNLVLPYMYNTMNGSHESEQLSGLSDPMLMLNYKLLDQKGNPMEKWLHNLWVGAGLKAPLAEFQFSRTENLINPNFQLGSGSWDYLAMLNYTSMSNRFGLNLEAVYKFNTFNSQDYRFGNQYNAQANVFYKTFIGGTQLFPLIGVYHEFGGQHTHEGFLQANSGGRLSMAQVGAQAQFKTWMLHTNYQVPISQDFNSDTHVTIQAQNRFSLTVVKFIGKRKEQNVFSFQPD
ncbi:hypothetical protein [Indibacter alkaliphilus]|uniref:hypothetical protein n=1 Tax=Indibacter alkaliphilus TaxID=579922 RepID=UPI0002823148|nr:hypothetical protein [Indibacter alkaliphilus]